MSDGRYMEAYRKYEIIHALDKNWFEPIVEDIDEETGDYKEACERHLMPIQVFIEEKLEMLKSEGGKLSDDDTPEKFELLFSVLDDVRTEDAIFVLEGLNSILFDRILSAMSKGLQNGTIKQGDLEPPIDE